MREICVDCAPSVSMICVMLSADAAICAISAAALCTTSSPRFDNSPEAREMDRASLECSATWPMLAVICSMDEAMDEAASFCCSELAAICTEDEDSAVACPD